MLSLYPKKSSRLSKKLDSIFWWLIKLLPLIIFLIVNIGFFTAKPIWQYFADDGDWSDFFSGGTSLALCLEHVGFGYQNFLTAILEDIFSDYINFSIANYFLGYFSYLVFIEILHILYDVIVFIPRLARKWINMACQDD